MVHLPEQSLCNALLLVKIFTLSELCYCDYLSSCVQVSLRSAGVFPVVASLPPKIVNFRRERSNDRKYVCASQATCKYTLVNIYLQYKPINFYKGRIVFQEVNRVKNIILFILTGLQCSESI